MKDTGKTEKEKVSGLQTQKLSQGGGGGCIQYLSEEGLLKKGENVRPIGGEEMDLERGG